jgi:hypothetical protein
MAVLLKCVLLFKVAPGAHPLYGWFYWRWWIVHTYVDLLSQLLRPMMCDSCLFVFFYRLLGAKIGRGCSVEGFALQGWDLLEIEDEVTVAASALLRPCYVKDGTLFLRTIRLGRGSALSESSILVGQCAIAEGERVPRLRAVLNDVPCGSNYSAQSLPLPLSLPLPSPPPPSPRRKGHVRVSVPSWVTLIAWWLCLLLIATVAAVPIYLVTTSIPSLVFRRRTPPFMTASLVILCISIYWLVYAAITVCVKRVLFRTPKGTVLRTFSGILARKIVNRLIGMLDRVLAQYLFVEYYRALGASISSSVVPSVSLAIR